MANANKGEVTLEAGGKIYRLQFTTNAMCELEDATGQTITKIVDGLADASNPPGLRLMRTLLWAALIEHQENITLKDAGRICDAIGVASIGEVVGDAIQAAFPEPEKDAGKARASKT